MPEYSRLIPGIACIALVILACITAGCSSGPAPATPAPATASSGGGNTIAIRNFAFDPSSLTVKAGSTVTWVNSDSAPHTIVSEAGAPAVISSDTLANGASFTFTFTRPGTYPYHCSIHPSMKGTIIVQ